MYHFFENRCIVLGLFARGILVLLVVSTLVNFQTCYLLCFIRPRFGLYSCAIYKYTSKFSVSPSIKIPQSSVKLRTCILRSVVTSHKRGAIILSDIVHCLSLRCM